jgi:hypothetical protein
LRGWKGGGDVLSNTKKKNLGVLYYAGQSPKVGHSQTKGLNYIQGPSSWECPQQLENILNCHIWTMDLDLVIIIIVISWSYIDFLHFKI